MLVFGNEVATEYNKRIAGRTLAIGSFKNNQEKKCEQSYLERISFVSTYIDSDVVRSEEHTSELQSLMRISYAVFCLKKKNNYKTQHQVHKQSLNQISKNTDN